MDEPTRILFVCTGNSCRSQIAEGWARHLSDDRFEIASAGIEAHGQNPRAIEAMREADVDISVQQSTVLDARMVERADVVVTLCGHAEEHCPALPPGVRKFHWPLADPARAAGTDGEIANVFRATRDEIRRRVDALLQRLREENSA